MKMNRASKVVGQYPKVWHIIRIPEELEKDYGRKDIWRNNGWCFPNLVKDLDLQILSKL